MYAHVGWYANALEFDGLVVLIVPLDAAVVAEGSATRRKGRSLRIRRAIMVVDRSRLTYVAVRERLQYKGEDDE